MNDAMNFQTRICTDCFDDHSTGNHDRCVSNLKQQLQQSKEREVKLIKVLEEYANKENWSQITLGDNCFVYFNYGYHPMDRARAILKEVKSVQDIK